VAVFDFFGYFALLFGADGMDRLLTRWKTVDVIDDPVRVISDIPGGRQRELVDAVPGRVRPARSGHGGHAAGRGIAVGLRRFPVRVHVLPRIVDQR
jgi:hypothetical protein